MSKVICDVCGTTYPETASQCPICGCAKTSTVQTAAGEGAQQASAAESSYSPVKGGRFSKSNVRKRNSSAGKAAASTERRSGGSREQRNSKNNNSNTGLVIVVVILLIAIIAVVAYIGIKFFGLGGSGSTNESKNTNPSTSQSTPPATDDSTAEQPEEMPCVSLQLSNVVIELNEVDASWLLTAEPDPVDTTDEIKFSSSDDSVATVNDEGVVTARGSGQTIIVVTCGEATAQCRVVCSFGEETEPSTEPSETTPPTDGGADLKLNSAYQSTITGKYDVTLKEAGQVWHAYKGSIPVTEIVWSTDDPGIATIDEHGKVTAVAPGRTEIHGQYNGETVTAIVRCSWSNETTPPATEETQPGTEATQPPETQAPQPGTEAAYYMIVKVGSWSSRVENGGEFTISQGESVVLELRAADGTVMTVSWSPLDPAICTASGNTITGAAVGATEVACKAPDGSVLSCLVRVKAS